MILIVGLGNPGKKFQDTRHNLGWMVLDLLQKKWEEEYNFSDWKEIKKFKAKVSKGEIKNKKIILAKPLTFMNLSGETIKPLVSYYRIKHKDLFVIHDDIDILLGKIKIVKNRGTAGHKGVQSIISNLKTKNFVRFRIGIKPKNNERKAISNIEKFVLLKFSKQEKEIVKGIIKKTAGAIATAMDKKAEEVMNEFN